MSLSKKAVQAIQNVLAVGITKDNILVCRIRSQSEGVVRKVAITRYDYAGRRTTYHRCPACENGRICYHLYVSAGLSFIAQRPTHPFTKTYRLWQNGQASLEHCANILEMAIGKEIFKWRHIPEEPEEYIEKDLTPAILNRAGDWGTEQKLPAAAAKPVYGWSFARA